MEFQSKNLNDEEISHLALDIGGTLVKMVCFLTNSNSFETSRISDCIEFLSSKKLQRCCTLFFFCFLSGLGLGKYWSSYPATGGGAFKFAELFKEKLGIALDKADEMDCLVSGANFLLKVVQCEAFAYMDGKKEYIQIDQNDLYPYLLVNIGSGVSMIKVDGEDKFQRVSGTSVGGGTFLGLGKLLTNCKSFDDLLELSHQGNNRVIDMLVGDIYDGLDYSKIGLTSNTIASSFGKAITEHKELEDYKPEDIARSLLSHQGNLKTNNLSTNQVFCKALVIAYLNALRFGLKRIFFGGVFIRGHAYTMNTISVAVDFWSKGEAKAMFLRHEGFLGALGAFTSCERDGFDDMMTHELVEHLPSGVSSSKDGAIKTLIHSKMEILKYRIQL
ncbi:kinase [Lithospermum erythrorhizon]|uniref:Kinase n=1 Tax=Lithospermum erythrorhizon TaxID=34254 RepID=A0AAV3QDQ1_LITER